MKLNAFATLISVYSFSAFASNPAIEAKVQPIIQNGKPAISHFWNEPNKIGVAQATVKWSEFDSNLHGGGFILGKATQREVVLPVLPTDCHITSINGFLSSLKEGSGNVAINLNGNCQSVMQQFESSAIHLKLYNVPSLDGQTITDELDVTVQLAHAHMLALADLSGPCAALVGKYSKEAGGNDTFAAEGIKIQLNPVTSTLELTYNSDKSPKDWNGWIESYIVDGQPHPGDQNTGKTYTASCQGNQLNIRREGLLLYPLITTLTLKGDQLHFVEYAETAEQHATHAQWQRVQ